MFSSIIMCFAAFILFNKCDGRIHRRNKLVRRQYAPIMPPPSNMMQGSYPVQPAQTLNPPLYDMPPKLEISSSYPPPPNAVSYLPPLPPPPPPPAANPPVSSGSAAFPSAPGQASYPGNYPNFGPNGLTSQTLAAYNPISPITNLNPIAPLNKRANLFRKNAPENRYERKNLQSSKVLHSYFHPSIERIERRRKSVLVKKNNSENRNKVHRHLKPAAKKRKTKDELEKKGEMEKLLEEGKKILVISTESKFVGEETSSKSLDNFFEDGDEINGNATVIPIPKGIQLKTKSGKGNKHVEETVNITSSTQKTLTIGNNTEIENVVEMEMEKKIEDDKGDSKGSEQVKIVETERVKPIMIKKGDSLTQKHRKRRFPLRKLFKQHRSKRSTTHSASFYRKMMKKFLSDLNRRERTVRMTGLLNRIESTTLGQSDAITKVTKKTDRFFKEEKNAPVRDKSMYDSDEMEEFLKQILAQLIKLRKTRVKNKLRNKHWQYFKPNQKDNDLYFARHRKKHHGYPEHKKMVMNLNMTWDDELQQHLIKSETKPERYEGISMESSLTNIVTSTTQRAFTVLYLQDKKDSRLLVVVIILCVMTFLLPLLLCILPQVSKLKKGCSALQICKFCPESGNNKGKEEICRFHRENFASDEYLQFEWQSENGDWLSEKEIEFK